MTSLLTLALLLGAGGAPDASWDQPLRFVAAAHQRGLPLTLQPAADWADIPPAGGLLLLRPDTVAQPEQLRRYVQAGGRLLLAVEGVADAPALAPFGLRPVPAPPGPRLGDHPALIEIAVATNGFFPGVRTLVANHPTGVASDQALPPAIAFADGTPFGWRLRLGEGELLVIGDASLFIDLMRPVADNARFLDEISDWLGAEGRPITVLTGPLTGAGPSAAAPGLADHINRNLEHLARLAPSRLLTLALSLLAALLACLLAWRGALGARLTPPRPAPPHRRTAAAHRAGAPGGPAAPDHRTDP